MRFKDRVVLVTGSTRGIGRGIAEAFSREGAIVAVNGSKAGLCDKVAEEIAATGGGSIAVPGDVSNSEAVKKIFTKITDEYGRLDILVNNAGVIYVANCVDTTDEQWDRTFAVNCRGVFLCSREAAGIMMKRKSGCVVNVASQMGKTGWPLYSHYCASKFAVVGFTQSLARELARYSITVNAVCPGVVDTDMMKEELQVLTALENKSEAQIRGELHELIPLRRYETPEDVSHLVLFLASTEGSYITGQAYNITGGIEVH